MSNLLTVLRSDPSSEYYNAYSKPTSTAVKNLTALGFNTSLLNDDFFGSQEYQSFMAANLEHSDTTGGVKSPSKKSTRENQIAYYLDKAYGDYETTKKAKEEYNAAMNEAMYLAGNPGWNYSDEKILETVKQDFDKKYPTLAKMQSSVATPVALTEAVDFSEDALLGAMWAARNPEYQGGLEGAMANSYLGRGNVWQEDEKVTSLLNPEDPNYNPFATGSTNMLKAGMTLGQYSFEEGYVQNNQDKYYNGTEAEKEAILWVDKGEQNQQAVDTATTALYGYVNSLLSSGETDSGKVQEAIDTALAGKKLYTYTNKNGEEIYTTKKPSVKNYEEVDLSILNEIDKQCGKTVNGVRSLPVTDPDELLPMTRGTSYKYDSLIPQVTDLCAQNAEILSEADTVNDIMGYGQGPINPEIAETEHYKPETTTGQEVSPEEIAGQSVQTGTHTGMPETEPEAAGVPAGKTLSSPTDLGPLTIITEADKKQMEEGNKKIREAADTVENVASENEATVMKYAGTISFNPIKNYLTAMRMNPGVMQGIVDKDINKASKAAMDSGLKSAHDMAAYETLKLQNDANVARFNELQAKYGNVEDYNKDIQTGLVKQIGDYTVTLTLDDSDPEKLKYIVSDISSPTMNADYGMIMDQARMEQEDGVSGWASQLIAEAEAQCEPEAKEANRIAAVQTKIAALGEEGAAEINEYKTLNAQIAKENQKLAQDRETYEQAQAELKKTTSKLNMMAETAFILGADSSRVVDAYDFLRDMLNYHDEPQLPMQGATKLEQILSYGEYMGNDYTTAQASEILHQQMENVDDRIRQIDQDIAYADKIGYQMPGDYARNIQLKREDLVNEKRALEYSAILTDVDSNEFDNAVNAAKAFEEKYGESSMNYWVNLFSSDDFRTLLYNDRYTMDTGDGREAYSTITDEEKDIYYYLLGKKILEMGDSLDEALKNINTNEQGAQAALREAFSEAAEYERFMEDDQSGYGVWSNREYDQSVEYGRELVESGPLGGTLANIGATMVTPGESIAAALYTFDRLITGGRFSEKSLANRLTGFKNETREATRESINEYYQDNPVMKFIANIGYEIYCNRGDSAMNALTFGMLFPQVSNPILNELLGASPMGVTAGLNAAIQAVENGANTNQAWLILGTTFMAETMTEALTRSNIMEALGDTRELNTETLKQFFKEWLTGSGVEEMFGESANDLIENYFNRGAAEWFDNPNFESDHQKLIDKYYAEGYTGEGEAETKAYEEELKGIAHTAFVSYLSAGADVMTKVGRTALNTVKTAADVVNGYRGYTKAQQKMGYGESMLDYMARDLKNRNKTNTPASAQEAGAAAAKQLTADQVRAAGDVATLQRVEGSTPVTQTEALASILDNGDGGDAVSERANAAATFLMRIMGKDANDTVQKVMNGVSKTNVSREAVTTALQNAALGNGAATVLVKSEAFKNASNEQKARMLADTVQQDQASQAVQQNIMATVKDYRRAVGINELAANGHFDQANADRAAADAATKDVAKAQTALDEKEQALEQAVEDAQQKADAVASDPSDINKKEHQDAVTNVSAADESRKQYEQHLANEQEKKDAADAKAQKSAEDAMTTAREVAEQKIVQEDQQRNEKEQYRQALIDNGIIDREYDTHSGAVDLFASEEEMQARENANFSYDNSNGDVLLTGDVSENVKQMLEDAGFSKREGYNADTGESGEYYVINQNNISPDQLKVINDAINAEKAQMKAEEDERTGKAEEDRSNAAINAIADDERLEGAEREQRIDALTDQNEKVKFRLRDLKSSVSTPEGYLALGALERKLGIKIELADLGEIKPEGWTRGQYVYDKDTGIATIRINKNMKVGQALVEACLHEITHSMKNTGAYDSYRNLVLESMFGTKGAGDALSLYNSEEGNKSGFTAEIDQMIEDRLKAKDSAFVGKSHDDQVLAAEEEIVADFARMNLAEKDVVQRFMDAGLGGKMRNTLHNINQAIKNFKLTGDERKTAEYLRRAERMYQKAIDEVSKTSVHPDSNQFSIAQFAQSAGMTFNAETLQLFDKEGKEIDGVNNKITPEMMNNTPVGMLIDSGLSDVSPGNDKNGNRIPSQREAAKNMMAGLMNMVARYKDSNLVWEIGATTLSSTFSALKSNSDPQYKTTVDFGTVCAKTQAIIDTLSQVMLDKVANGEYGGLNRKDIMKVYDAVNKAGLSVPCPVCYVFSRWMGVPSLLGQMSQYQHDYVVTNEDGTIDKKATQKKVDAYIKSAESKYGDAKAINNQKTKLQNKRTKLEEQRTILEAESRSKSITEEERANLKKQLDGVLDEMVKLDNQIGEVSAYNWITQALCKKDKSGKFVVDDKFQLTPDEILFDLNRTGEFAGYTKNWAYRNTRGAGMGKAIMPYSGETIGDILYGVKKGGRQSSIKNPWLNLDSKAAARQLREAQARARKQNLVGGQRLQSTSDFRPEWGLDYIMSFLELQAAGSKVQMYTKVAEAVDLFASVGADVNLSIMGKGTGWHEATAEEIAAMTPEQRERATIDGKVYVLDFSDVTGMKYGTAVDLKNKYDNVQMILVGMNDTHIRLAMANSDIDFIIPWHSSGNSKDILAGLISAVGEKLDSSVDYTTTQSDMVKGTVKKYKNENGETVEYTVPGQQTKSEKALWDARMKLLTKGGEALTLAERKTLLSNPITADLYKRFTQKGVDDDCYGVKLSKEQANQIFPYEYWDTTSTKENADINGKRFVEYCEAMGIVPRFSQFKDDPGYWKLLIDRPMYNNDRSYHSQQVIDVTNARIGDLNESGQLEDSDLPTQAQAKYAPKDPRNPNYEQYTEAQKNAVENAEAAIDSKYDDGEITKNSVFGTQTEADREVMRLADEDYMDAVARGDMKAAQEDVDYAAEQAGYTTKAYHGTTRQFNAFRFTSDDLGIHLGTKGQARMMAGRGKDARIIEAYVKLENPIHFERDLGAWEGKRVAKELYDMGIITEQEAANALLSPDRTYRLSDEKATKNIRDLLISKGYDGFVYDNDFEGYSKKSQQSIAVFNPNQIKLADPVTYDSQGNVIPLSQRFSDSADIRYSSGGQMTEADRQVMQQIKTDSDYEKYLDTFDDATNTLLDSEIAKLKANRLGKLDNLLVGGTPQIFKEIGLPALPLVIDKKHVKDSLNGTRDADHTLGKQILDQLPYLLKKPIAIIESASRPNDSIVAIVGKKVNNHMVISAVEIGGQSWIDGDFYDANIISTAFGKSNAISKLLVDAINKENAGQVGVYYINKTRARSLVDQYGVQFPASFNQVGPMHSIFDVDSPVNRSFVEQTDTIQFKKWFDNSKVKNPDGSPKVVYHGTNEDFTAFDMTKGRSTMDIQGAFFTPYEIEAEGYGENVGKFYLSIQNPAPEQVAYAALRKYQGQNEAGRLAKEDLQRQGYDGVVYGVGDDTEEYIAFEPGQIKSADKNIGMFDRNNPDYRYSTGGEMTDADQAVAREAELNQALVDYGVITPEELDAYQQTQSQRPLEGQNPGMSTAQGPAQRAFGDADGMLRSSDEIAGFAKAVVDAQNSYFPDTNSEQINRAIKWIRSLKQTPDSDGYAEAMNAVTKDNFDYRSADGQARMVAVMGLAVARNDTMAQVALADAFNRQGTDLGRALQSRKLFKLMTPAGRISTLQKMIDNYNVDLKKNGNQEIKFSDWIYQAAAYADNADDFHKVLVAAANELAEQLPISWKERANSLRMLSMLANPRTHIRNLVGNALFVPAVGLKNKMGALMEKAFVKKGERTKTLSPVLRSDIREFARQDARAIRDMLTGEAKYDESSLVQKAKNPLGPVLGWMSDINSKALEGEDWLFLRGHYRKALGGWMQANGYTVDQVKNNKKLLEKGRAYAINEAQKATYRDFNGVAQSLNQWARNTKTPGQKALAFAVNAVLPFKKTPANILKRGIEYSPLGVARGVYNLGKKFLGGDISANQVIDQITSGVSGTLAMALGFLLAGTGAVSCGFDDDDWVEELKGKQKYSINPGQAANEFLKLVGIPKLFGEDVTYTMDWAAPMAMPFFVGASIRNQADEEGFDMKKFLSSMLTITEPVFNLSMLDGVNTLLKTSSYSSEAPYAQIGAKILSNYVTSYVPSVLGAIARTRDDTQRKSYVKKEDKEDLDINGVWHYAIEQMQNKIPGRSQTNIPVRDVWGNAKVSDLAERIIENWVSPGYIEHVQDDPVVNELGRLFDSTKSKYLEPQHAEQSIEGKGLTAEEYDTRDRVHGETQYSMLKELFDNPDYQDITNDDIKVETVQKIYSYADKVARAAVDEEYRYEKQTVGEIIKDAKISNYKSKMMKDIEDGNWEGYADYVELLHEEGVEDTKIKEKIANTYREEWKNAYRDYLESDTQSEKDMYRKKIGNIEDLLEKTGYEYNIYGNGGWKQKVDEQNGTEGEEIEPAEKETPKTNKPLMTLNSPTGRQAAGYIASTGMSDVGSGRSTMPKRPASDADWGQYMNDLDDYWADYDFSGNDPVGQYGQGNIDLNNRQIAQNDDGSISTERSFSFYDERTGKEVLIPLVADGRVLTEEEAIDRYYETGEYLGMFDDWHDADEYAMMLHNRQDWFYNR